MPTLHRRIIDRVAGHYCYMLECADGSYYTGWTTDPQRRLQEHRAGYGARYTRSRRPLRLVYLEAQPTRAAAMRRERALKRLTRMGKLRLIESSDMDEAPYD